MSQSKRIIFCRDCISRHLHLQPLTWTSWHLHWAPKAAIKNSNLEDAKWNDKMMKPHPFVGFFEGEVFDSYRLQQKNFETENCDFLQIYNLEVSNAKGTTVVCESSGRLNSDKFFQRILCTYAVTSLKHHFGEFSMTSFVRFGLLVWSTMIWTYHYPVLIAELVNNGLLPGDGTKTSTKNKKSLLKEV